MRHGNQLRIERMNNPSFTSEQIDFICSQIGHWYHDWKYKINSTGETTHRLGIAKEELKSRICDTGIERYRRHRIEITHLHPNYKFTIPFDGVEISSMGVIFDTYEKAFDNAKKMVDSILD